MQIGGAGDVHAAGARLDRAERGSEQKELRVQPDASRSSAPGSTVSSAVPWSAPTQSKRSGSSAVIQSHRGWKLSQPAPSLPTWPAVWRAISWGIGSGA